jgi:hypothetical protein
MVIYQSPQLQNADTRSPATQKFFAATVGSLPDPFQPISFELVALFRQIRLESSNLTTQSGKGFELIATVLQNEFRIEMVLPAITTGEHRLTMFCQSVHHSIAGERHSGRMTRMMLHCAAWSLAEIGRSGRSDRRGRP